MKRAALLLMIVLVPQAFFVRSRFAPPRACLGPYERPVVFDRKAGHRYCVAREYRL